MYSLIDKILPSIDDYTLTDDNKENNKKEVRSKISNCKNSIIGIYYEYQNKYYYWRNKTNRGYDYLFEKLTNIEKVDYNKMSKHIDDITIHHVYRLPYENIDKWRIAKHLYLARLALYFMYLYGNTNILACQIGYQGILETYLREFFTTLAYIVDNGKNNATTKAIRKNLEYRYPESVNKIMIFRDQYFAHNDDKFDYRLITNFRCYGEAMYDLQRIYQDIMVGCRTLYLVPNNFTDTNGNYHPDLYRIQNNITIDNEKSDIDTTISSKILLNVLPPYIVDSYKTGLNLQDRLHRLQIMCINHNIQNKSNFYVTYSALEYIENCNSEEEFDKYWIDIMKGINYDS